MSTENKAFVHAKTGNLVTPKGKILWNHLFTPGKAKGNVGDPKYDINILIPKSADIAAMKEAIVEAGKEKFSKAFKDAAGKWPSSVRNPFKKTADNDKLVAGLEEAGLKVEDWPLFVAARSKDKPGVVGPNGKPDGVDDEQVYPGRYARATLQAFGYDQGGNKGVTFGLVNVQLLDNDDELVIGSGRVSAETEFDAVDGAGEDSKSSDDVFA
jgi:hypothetical protein